MQCLVTRGGIDTVERKLRPAVEALLKNNDVTLSPRIRVYNSDFIDILFLKKKQ